MCTCAKLTMELKGKRRKGPITTGLEQPEAATPFWWRHHIDSFGYFPNWHYQWLRSLTADRNKTSQTRFPTLFEVTLWEDNFFYILLWYNQLQLSPNRPRHCCRIILSCMILSGFRRFWLKIRLLSAFKAAIEQIKCTYANCVYFKFSCNSEPGAIIGDGDRKRALIPLLGLSPWYGTIFLFFEQIAPSPLAHARTCCKDFCVCRKGEMTSVITEMFDTFGSQQPTTQYVHVCWSFVILNHSMFLFVFNSVFVTS